MSHYIDTKHAQHWGTGRLSFRQLVEIVIGIAVIVVRGVAAFAFVNSTGTPVSDTAVDAATLELITHSALDPFETQFVTPQDTAIDAATLELITHSALDPFETQFVTPPGTAIDTATLELITHSALDPFETQFVTPQGTIVEELSDLIVEGSAYPMPEFL